MNSHRCCFTGHRPEKMNISEQEAKARLQIAIRQAIADGFTVFISGMARGIDMWAAEIVLAEQENNDIKLVCACPYNGFQSHWNLSEQNKYNIILKNANVVKYVCSGYSRSCFQTRNCYMVDHSARVIAAYNGTPGGTRNTVIYAQKKGVEVVNILKGEE